jgi:hypothetical protein
MKLSFLDLGEREKRFCDGRWRILGYENGKHADIYYRGK